MFPNYCNAMGFVGWIVTLLVWSGMVALVVWGITKLFPGPRRKPPPTAAARTVTEPVSAAPVATDPVSVVVPPTLAPLGRR